jgi:2,4-dienoyl-CoA reductase-like NADH-dependent reductase (Old Yellow Enzyme family)
MMNERIKELMKQATTIRYSGPGEIEEFNKEKFAELMLKDVLTIVGYGGEFCSRPKLVEQLKEHFGVEE